MSDPICSILIPSRGRVSGLREAIESFQQFSTPWNFEIIVRADDDDLETIQFVNLLNDVSIRLIIGNRGAGYDDIGKLYTEAAEMATAPWVWIFNDDAVVRGVKWDVQLSSIPTTGFIVQPEHVTNGGSHYSNVVGGPFPIVPNGCWTKLGWDCLPSFVDVMLHELLLKNAWKTRFLNGVTVLHDRKVDSTLTVDRF